MENKLETIETTEYTLVVSEEGVKEGDFIYNEERYPSIIQCVGKGSLRDWKKIIAYKPKGNAPELDLPLLPEMVVEDDAEKLAEQLFPVFQRSTPFGSKYPWIPHKERQAFRRGYKTATKVYSEDDLIDLVKQLKDYTCESHNILGHDERDAKDFVDIFKKSLKQPKYFIAEIGKTHCDRCPNGFEEYLVTEEVEGKTYLKGKFTNK